MLYDTSSSASAPPPAKERSKKPFRRESNDEDQQDDEEAVDENVTDGDGKVNTPKTRKVHSGVWKYCIPDRQVAKAICRGCGFTMKWVPKDGTKNLWNHVRFKCPLYSQQEIPNKVDLVSTQENEHGFLGEEEGLLKSNTVAKKRRRKPQEALPSILLLDNETSLLNLASGFNQKQSHRLQLMHLIKNDLPFSSVLADDFRMFCLSMNAHYTPVSINGMLSDLAEMSREAESQLKSILSQTSGRGKVSFSVDTWQTSYPTTYSCVTAHFIDKYWNMIHVVIGFHQNLRPGNDIQGEDIAAWVWEDACMALQVPVRDVFSVVTSNNVTDLRTALHTKLGRDCHHGQCLARTLGAMVEGCLKDLAFLMDGLRRNVQRLHSNPAQLEAFSQALTNLQNTSGNESLQLPLPDVSTHWNSTHTMIKHALRFQENFDLYHEMVSSECTAISETTWTSLQHLVDLLEPIKRVVLATCAYKKTRSHQVFFMVIELRELFVERLQSLREQNEDHLVASVLKMQSQLLDYIRTVEDSTSGGFDSYVLASILDPTAKLHYLPMALQEDSDTLARVTQLLTKTFDEHYAQPSQPTATSAHTTLSTATDTTEDVLNSSSHQVSFPSSSSAKAKRKRLNNDSSDNIRVPGCVTLQPHTSSHSTDVGATPHASATSLATSDALDPELDRYLREPIEPLTPDFHLLQWWDNHEMRFPRLARMAKDFLALRASAVPLDAACCPHGRVLSNHRARLSAVQVRDVVVLASWFKRNEEAVENEEARVDDCAHDV